MGIRERMPPAPAWARALARALAFQGLARRLGAGQGMLRRCVTRHASPDTRAGRLLHRLFGDSFARERQALVAGIQRYHREVPHEARNQALLRRRIHMLEKGLSMRPRRDVFALDYIGEAVAAYALRHAHVTAQAGARAGGAGRADGSAPPGVAGTAQAAARADGTAPARESARPGAAGDARVSPHSGARSSTHASTHADAHDDPRDSIASARASAHDNAAGSTRANAHAGIAPPHRGVQGAPGAGAVDGTLVWAHDVLARYFEVSAPHPVLAPLRTRFAALPPPAREAAVRAGRPGTDPVRVGTRGESPSGGETRRESTACEGNPACEGDPAREAGAETGRHIPFARDLAAPLPVAYADLLALAVRRRSVRWFRPEPVPRALFEKALAVAAQSPTACNRQPFVFRVFDEAGMVRQVAETAMGTRGYGHNLPMIAVLVGQQRHVFDARDRHLIYIDGALAAMALCLALETLGLSSCLINWPDIEAREAALARLIDLDADERPVMLIAIGHPDPGGLVPYSAKKALCDLVRYG